MMTKIVNISDFRANIFKYMDWVNKQGGRILLKRKNEILGQIGPKAMKNKKKDKIDVFLEDIEELNKKYPFKAGKDLSLSVDEILYGKK